MPALDLEHVRRQFPAIARAEPWALMDNAGGSVPCRQVIDRVSDYMERFAVQLGASYPLSRDAETAVEAGKAAAATLLGASPEEVLISGSTTMNVYLLAQAMRTTLKPGDEIVVTDLDHEANIGAWRRLELDGIHVHTWPLHVETASLRFDELAPLLGPRTRLVCFTHCANVVGNIHDVPALISAIRATAPKARVCVDGVAYAPHRRIRTHSLDADIYLASLYKVYGPHVGVAYVRRDLLDALPSQNHFFIGDEAGPYKLEPGNVNHELTASLVGIVEYLRTLVPGDGDGDGDAIDRAFEAIAAHEARLAAPVIDFLRAHPRVRLLGAATPDAAARAPTIAFVPEGRHASEIPAALDERKVAIRWGDFYARHAIERLGLADGGGVVRVSMVHYNTPDEVARLLAALDDVL